MSDLFCRHNRFTADCPICSKGTVLDSGAAASRPRARAQGSGRGAREKTAGSRGAQFRGPYASAGPYERDGERVEVRLEKVPGGVRLAEWAGGALRRQAPVLPAADVRALIAEARERQILPERDLQKLESAVAGWAGVSPGSHESGESGESGGAPAAAGSAARAWGASAGRTGDLQEELRVEALAGGDVRVGRWILRPGAGWELQDAPPMLPAARFAEALAAAARGAA